MSRILVQAMGLVKGDRVITSACPEPRKVRAVVPAKGMEDHVLVLFQKAGEITFYKRELVTITERSPEIRPY